MIEELKYKTFVFCFLSIFGGPELSLLLLLLLLRSVICWANHSETNNRSQLNASDLN